MTEGILGKGCMCGHDHHTHRGEFVDMCLECSCSNEVPCCQNCGSEVPVGRAEITIDRRFYDVCSSSCQAQLTYAIELRKGAPA